MKCMHFECAQNEGNGFSRERGASPQTPLLSTKLMFFCFFPFLVERGRGVGSRISVGFCDGGRV